VGTILSETEAIDCRYGQFDSPEDRPVTYQLILRGCDGIVIASDKRELQSGIPIRVRKIRIDKTGGFAWCFSGPIMVATFSRHAVRAFEKVGPLSDREAADLLASCAEPALADSRANEMPGGSGDAMIVLACGASKRIFRAILRPITEVEPIDGDYIVAGQKANLASFFPVHFFSPEMTVDKLASLAAYSIRMASSCDPLYVDGLDIAVYRDSVGRFEFTDGEYYWNEAEKLDRTIENTLMSINWVTRPG
jgi:hypothetical protein